MAVLLIRATELFFFSFLVGGGIFFFFIEKNAPLPKEGQRNHGLKESCVDI